VDFYKKKNDDVTKMTFKVSLSDWGSVLDCMSCTFRA
jgi:hypothetical protein